jgi:hypothetical protein
VAEESAVNYPQHEGALFIAKRLREENSTAQMTSQKWNLIFNVLQFLFTSMTETANLNGLGIKNFESL